LRCGQKSVKYEGDHRKIESTLAAIKIARASESLGSASQCPSSESSANRVELDMQVAVSGTVSVSSTFNVDNALHSTQANLERKQEFVWVDIDPHALDRLPSETVRAALEGRNNMRRRELCTPNGKKARQQIVPALELKFSSRAGVNAKNRNLTDEEDPAVIEWNPDGWDDPEFVTPRSRKRGIISPGVFQAFANSWSNALRKTAAVRSWRSPKFSSSTPAVVSRARTDDEVAFLSARDDDVKVGEGQALLKPSDIRKKTPRGKREASKANWGDCPLTMDTIKVPVRAGDGKVYERWAIEKWLKENANRSPLTNVIIDPKLTPLDAPPAQSVSISGSHFGIVEEEEDAAAEEDAAEGFAVGPFLVDELRHLDGDVLSLLQLRVPAGTRKGQALTFDWHGGPARAVYTGPVYKQEHMAVFALVESAELKVQAGAVPGGLSGLRARMAAMGHSVRDEDDDRP